MLLSEPGRTDYDINFEMFGIPVRVHPAFFILPVLLGRGMIDSKMNVGVGMLLVAALFFVSILIHELGHVFAYRLSSCWNYTRATPSSRTAFHHTAKLSSRIKHGIRGSRE